MTKRKPRSVIANLEPNTPEGVAAYAKKATPADLIVLYDALRRERNDAMNKLEKAHAELSKRVEKSKGVLRTSAGYAAFGFQTVRKVDPEVKQRLMDNGTLPYEIERRRQLNVVAVPKDTA